MALGELQLIDEYIDEFHVVELIGQGAMASVYRAFDTELERDVALKIPHFRFVDKSSFVERFGREAKALARIRHRNIVQIYSVGDHEGLPFMAMEYVDGVSLSQIMEDRERLEVDEAVEYLLQVCEAVECAHQKGIIHRDLKPGNIMVESSERILVTDFGISKIMTGSGSEETLTFVGTPIYMSPEQCGEGTLDQRTDIYSLGVIFYEMVVGRPPFSGETPAAIIKSHLMATPKFPSNNGLELSPRIVRIIRKMLAKSPDHRYPDAYSIAHELKLWKKETSARPAKVPEKPTQKDGTEPIVLCFITQRILLGAAVSALGNVNHNMVSVTNSSELLSKLANLNAKMVILSHEPGKNGIFKLAEKIRENPRYSDVKLILISNGISRHEVEVAFRSGINDIIAEPFDPSVLISKLESALVGAQRSVESRRFFRKELSDKILMRMECEIFDISEGGMRIGTNVAVRIGEIIKFELQLFRDLGFGEKAGKVVWISKTDGDAELAFQAGIDFVDITADQRDRLRRWIFTSEIAGRNPKASVVREANMGPILKK